MAENDPRTPIRQNIYPPDDPLSQALDRIQVLPDSDDDAMDEESDSSLDQPRSEWRSNRRRLSDIARQAMSLGRQTTELSNDDDNGSGQDLDQDETEQPQHQEEEEEEEEEEGDDEQDDEENNLPALNQWSNAADIRQWLDHASQLCTQAPTYIVSSAVFSYNTIQERNQERTAGGQDWSTFLSFMTQPIPPRKYCHIGFFSVWREDYGERREANSWAHAFTVLVISHQGNNQKTLAIWDAEMPARLSGFHRKPSNKRKPIRTTDVLLPRQRSIVGRVDNLTQVLVNSNEPRNATRGACVRKTIQFILAVARGQYGRCTVRELLQNGFQEISYPSLY